MMTTLNNVYVCDIECNGLLDELTKLHIVSVGYKNNEGRWTMSSTNDVKKLKEFFGNPNNTIVGHNFMCYDKPALEKLGFEVNVTIIDTLGLSWYLYNEHQRHGLEQWGERLGISKVEIEDWENLTYDQYKERCEEDVKINITLWENMLALLNELYDNEQQDIINVIKYLTFKMECLHIQEEQKILIDLDKCKENLQILEGIIAEKTNELIKTMPKIPVKVKRTKPKNLYKKPIKRPKTVFDKHGNLTGSGYNWHKALEENGLPLDYDSDTIENVLSSAGKRWFNLLDRLKAKNPDIDIDEVTELEEVTKEVAPNPSSSKQMKDYLLSLGWKPKYYTDGANGKVAQLKDNEKNLCPNIKKLFDKVPELKALDGLSVASHRAAYLKSFLKYSDDKGYTYARANGFTKTLRLKHASPFVNLPKPSALYGEYIRSVMVAPKGKVLIGSDVSSLEDKTKQIAIYSYDPEYVEQMNMPGWDAHLDIGLRASLLTEDEVAYYRWYKKKDKKQEDCPEVYSTLSKDEKSELFATLDKKRAVAKTVNYSCVPVDNTEVLTVDGWKKYKELTEDDQILSYNTDKDVIEKDIIEKVHFYKDAEVVSLSNKWWDIESTLNHRWFGSRRTGRGRTSRIEQEFFTTEEVNSEHSILNSAEYVGGSSKMTEDAAEFLGWLLSDGYYRWAKDSRKTSSSKGKKRSVVGSIAQSKKKFYSDVKSLLERLNVVYVEDVNNSGVEIFRLQSKWLREFFDSNNIPRSNKHDIDWNKIILNMSKECLKKFFGAFVKADGSSYSTRDIIYQNEGSVADAVELAGYLLGRRVTSSYNKKIVNKDGRRHRNIRFSKARTTTGQRLKRGDLKIKDVFCLTTGNGTFIIKQGSTITITGNCTYGAGAAKVAESANISVPEAKRVVASYWDRNWSIKKYAEERVTKEVDGKTWIYNPYSRMWLYLTSDHIRFSACNQNSGVKIFDLWVYFLIQNGIKPSAQFHDEVLVCVDKFDRERVENLMHECMEKVNQCFNYNIKFEVDVQVGKTYADVH